MEEWAQVLTSAVNNLSYIAFCYQTNSYRFSSLIVRKQEHLKVHMMKRKHIFLFKIHLSAFVLSKAGLVEENKVVSFVHLEFTFTVYYLTLSVACFAFVPVLPDDIKMIVIVKMVLKIKTVAY